MAVNAVTGVKLQHLLGKVDANSLIGHINAGSGTASPRLKMKLDRLFGRNNASSIYTIIGTANTVQPKFLRRLQVLLGRDEAQHLATEINAS